MTVTVNKIHSIGNYFKLLGCFSVPLAFIALISGDTTSSTDFERGVSLAMRFIFLLTPIFLIISGFGLLDNPIKKGFYRLALLTAVVLSLIIACAILWTLPNLSEVSLVMFALMMAVNAYFVYSAICLFRFKLENQ